MCILLIKSQLVGNRTYLIVACKSLIKKAFLAVKSKMSCKIPIINNGVSCGDQWAKSNSFVVETSVKLAGEEAKDRLYEPKHKKKLIRVLTVIAYVFFVSLAAIMLSLYYVFLWNGDQKVLPKYSMQRQTAVIKCDNVIAGTSYNTQICTAKL